MAAESFVVEALIRRHIRGEVSQNAVELATNQEATPGLETGTSRKQHKVSDHKLQDTIKMSTK